MPEKRPHTGKGAGRESVPFASSASRRRPVKIAISHLLSRIKPLTATLLSVAVLLSYLAGTYLTGHFHEASALTGAILACTSAIVVLQEQTVRDSLNRGWMRLLGTFTGAVVAYLYLSLFPFTIAGLILSIFVLELIVMILKVPDNGKMATITLVFVLIVSKQSPDLPPWENGLLRFSEAALGAGIGILLAWLKKFIP